MQSPGLVADHQRLCSRGVLRASAGTNARLGRAGTAPLALGFPPKAAAHSKG